MAETKDDIYKKAGLGGSVGFGERPVIIVVDFQNAYTDPRAATAGDLNFQCQQTKKLTDAAREKNIRVIYTRVGYSEDGIDLGLWGEKCPSLKPVTRDTWDYEWNQYLDVREEDVKIEKHWPSAFFGTHLTQMLIPMHIDTCIICGGTVGGCVYATVIDSCSYGFRTIIPRDAVGDRTKETYDMFLWNMNQKYGDVSSVDECIEYFKTIEPLEYEFQY